MRFVLSFAACLLFVAASSAHAQRVVAPPPDTLVAADYDAFTRVVPPSFAERGRAGRSASVQFEYDFTGFPAEAEAAFRFAGSIWATHLDSTVPVRVRARFEGLESDQLGAAGPACVEANQSGLPLQDTWYPVALAEATLGRELNPVTASVCPGVDITATFNREIDWYFGTDGNTPAGQYDFATVVLHELGHGLGFIGTFTVSEDGENCPAAFGDVPDEQGCWGLGGGESPLLPFAFDRFTEDANEVPLLDEAVYPNPSFVLGELLQSGAVFFDGTAAAGANADLPLDLYAPSNFESGSTFSHLDEAVSPPGSPNSLMTPQLARAEAIFSPGPFTCAVMRDLGWTLGADCIALLEGGLAGIEARFDGDAVILTFRLGLDSDFVAATLEEQQEDGSFAPVDAGIGPLDPVGGGTYTVRLLDLAPGTYTYRLRLIRTDGAEEFSRVVSVDVAPDEPLVVYPNPFVNQATLALDLRGREDGATVRVTIYDVLGRRVATLYESNDAPGVLSLAVRGESFAPGVYVVRIEGRGVEATRLVTRLR